MQQLFTTPISEILHKSLCNTHALLPVNLSIHFISIFYHTHLETCWTSGFVLCLSHSNQKDAMFSEVCLIHRDAYLAETAGINLCLLILFSNFQTVGSLVGSQLLYNLTFQRLCTYHCISKYFNILIHMQHMQHASMNIQHLKNPSLQGSTSL